MLLFMQDGFTYDALNFSTSIEVLNKMSKAYDVHRENFNSPKYMRYTLFRALVLNDLIVNDEVSKEFNSYFCDNDKDELIMLLKWKISVNFNLETLNKIGVKCDEKIQVYKQTMESYFLQTDFYDALIEYYYHMDEIKKNSFLIQNSVLRKALYSKPDKKILELLISNLKDEGLIDGEWNASILAARYGSDLGLSNMIKLIENAEKNNFLLKVKTYLW